MIRIIKECVMTDKAEAKGGLIENVSRYRPQIMGFAAIWIFIFHVRNDVTVFNNVPVLNDIDIFFVNIGFNGVDIFLLLSGWGLYHAINKHNLLLFFKRRYRRLVLPFVVACVATALLNHWSIARLIKAVTCWTFLTKDVHEPKWFVPAIAIMYLFFPLYHKLFEKFKNKYLFTGVVISLWLVLSFILPLITDRKDIYVAVGRIPVFLIGVLVGWFTYSKKKITKQWAVWAVIIPMLIAGFQTEYYVAFKKVVLLNPGISNALPGILIGIPMCLIVGQVFALLGKVTFIQKIYGFMGKITLEFYVVQEIVLAAIKGPIYYSGVYFNRHLMVLIVFIISLGCAYIIHMFSTVISKKQDGEPVFTKK